jgi:hypothetical protein
MRHLKVFNENNSDQFYTEIGKPSEARFANAAIDAIDFNVYNFNLIKNHLKPDVKIKLLKKLLLTEFDKIYVPATDLVKIITKNISIDIYETDDEWFYVVYNHVSTPIKYYKCDQIEGVLKLLKDKNIAN